MNTKVTKKKRAFLPEKFSVLDSPWIVPTREEGGYGVSADGRVWTRWTKNGYGYRVLADCWRELSPGGRKYKMVHLFDCSGRVKGHLVHRLVVSNFRGEIPIGMDVDHLDSCTTNNRLENLEVVTRKENIMRSSQRGRIAHGENHPNARATEEMVRAIREDYKIHGTTMAELARKYGMSEPSTTSIIKRKTWKHVIEEIAS